MTTVATSRALIDLFRCPAAFAMVRPQAGLSSEAGFFRFGEDVIGWGRTTEEARSPEPTGACEDILPRARAEAGALVLPFDLDEVAENLRWERYVAPSQGLDRSLFHRALRQGYYVLRPLLGVAVRKHLQRAYLRSWQSIPFPRWPVDTTVEALLSRALQLTLREQGLDRAPFIWFWPDGRRAAVMMTHDVETATGRDFAPRLMDVNDHFGLKSAFHVIPEERYEVSDAFLDTLRERGFEINVHGLNHDGRLFTYYSLFTSRAARINAYLRRFGARGFRSPVMYRNLDWIHHLDVEYDMSVPNVAHLDPQRGGCCTVFPYFVGGILELPLTTSQDYSLFNIMKDYSIDLWRQQIGMIVERSGLVSFNCHPDYLASAREMAVYQSLLAHLSEMREREQLWFALPGEINDWWRRRAAMRLVPDGGDWRIEGDGHERARLAYAILEGDRLVFQTRSGAPMGAI